MDREIVLKKTFTEQFKLLNKTFGIVIFFQYFNTPGVSKTASFSVLSCLLRGHDCQVTFWVFVCRLQPFLVDLFLLGYGDGVQMEVGDRIERWA